MLYMKGGNGVKMEFQQILKCLILTLVFCFLFFLFVFVFFLSLCLCRAALMAYGGSQARGLIRATAANLCQSYSNARSELHLRPTPQLTATPDPQPTEQGQGLNPQPHGS